MSFTSIRCWFIRVFIALPFYSGAQLQQNERLEIPISFDYESFEVAPTKDHGLVLYRKVGNLFNQQLEIIHTDTSFQEKWNGFLPIDKEFRFAKQIATQKNLYFIFYDEDFSDRNFHLYEIELTTGNYTKFIINNSLPFLPTTFEVTSNGALIGGYFNRVPIVLLFEFKIQKATILPGLFNETGELIQIKINPDESFDLLISQNYQKRQTLWLKNYDPNGRLIRNIMLQPDDNNDLIFGRTIQTNSNSQIITGVYGNRNSEYSRGLFVANITSDGVQLIKYYSYAELENFFKYMRVKQEKRVKERIERKKVKGKKIRFRYRFLVHELVPYKNQFILLGEAFYPRYRHIDRGYSGLSRTSYVFDGYQYTHAAVLGIDTNGRLLWDNSFEINDVRTFTLEQFVKMDAKEDEIALLYLYDNKIRTKVIIDSKVFEGKTSNPLQLKLGSKLSSEDHSNINKLDYWYGNYFLASGVQNMVSISLSGRSKKKVFFVSKVSYH